jgi:integral membrane protein
MEYRPLSVVVGRPSNGYYADMVKTDMIMKTPRSLHYLSILALAEGASLIALIAIAMPLKYFGGMPEAVRVVGMAHGLLFLGTTAMLLYVLSRGHISALKSAGVFAALLIPFAGLWSHRMLVRTSRLQHQA